MADGKKYYWLKLKNGFFDSLQVKKLRRIAGGDTLTIIYLKLLLYTMSSEGVIEYKGIESTPGEEIALAINEDPTNVGICLNFLVSVGLAEASNNMIFFSDELASVGTETESAERVRKFREKQKALHCNADVTGAKRLCNTDKDKEIDIDKETDTDKKKEGFTNVNPKKEKSEVVDLQETWFDKFWEEYPKKQDKKGARKSFGKVCKTEKDFETIMNGLTVQKNTTWKGKDMQYIPMPTTWLNGNRWEDEPIQPKVQMGFNDLPF